MADFELDTEYTFDCRFEVNVVACDWGDIEGDINDQTDLKDALDNKADVETVNGIDERLGTVEGTIDTYGNIVTHDTDEFASAEQGALAETSLQPNDNVSELVNDAGYITSSALPTVNNSTITIQKNGTKVEDFTLNQSTDKSINITVPTQLSELGTETQMSAINSGINSTLAGQITTNQNAISLINDKIPSQASSNNQLADKNFVNSSISTNTANFIGTFNSVADLEAYSGTLTNNDYAFVIGTDSDGNTVYNRYKYTTATTPASWIFEYALNNSSFTANQWASINSGANTTNIGQIATNTNDISDINTTIGGYGDIVTHDVSEFATASQGALADTSLQNGTDVIDALGYTPYNSTNPNNYSSTLNGLTDVSLTSPTQGQNLTYDAVNQKWINSSTTATVGWGGITGTLSDQTDLQNALNDKQDVIDANNKLSASYISGLSTVATSGSYDDLTDKPTIPSAQVNSDWNANSGVAQILNKPTLSTVATSGSYNDLSNKPSLSTVATSGSYNDLSNKPTIPTVNNATLTIQKNGTNVQTFTANASSDVTANITVPTDVSDLTNTSLANVSLSNLNTTGENRLYALKGYNDNGQILSDSILYNYLKSNYLSFDISKYIVTGTPTISNDGVASGFLSTNYVTVGAYRLYNASSWSVSGSFVTGTSSEDDKVVVSLMSSATNMQSYSGVQLVWDGTSTNRCRAYINWNGEIMTSSDGYIDYSPNTTVYYELGYSGGAYYLKTGASADNLTQVATKSSTTKIADVILRLGICRVTANYNYYRAWTTGTINLKDFKLTIDGAIYFDGSKNITTGTDTYNTYTAPTVVGALTVSDQVYTGWSVSKYLTCTIPTSTNFSKSWTIRGKVLMDYNTSVNTNYSIVTFVQDHSEIRIFPSNNGYFNFRLNAGRTNTLSTGSYLRSDYNTLFFEVTCEAVGASKTYTIKLKANKTDAWTVGGTYTTTEDYTMTTNGTVTICKGFASDWSFDWKEFEIICDNKILVCGHDLQIPYVIDEYGHKIISDEFRERLPQIINLVDYCPYFSIDTTNANSTLPMSDLYSMIAKSTPEYLKTVSGYNGSATQTLKNVNGTLTWVTD